MSGNVYKRYVWLLDLINRSNGITLEEISSIWQRCSLNETGERLPPRTFHNHLQKIYEIFGIKIVSYGKEYRIVNSGDIDLDDAQQSLLAHLQISNALFSNPEMARRISIDGYMSFRYFTPLIEAMEEGKVVELHSPEHKRKVDDWHIGIKVEPYYIDQLEDNWFVVGRDVDSNSICAFAFSNIMAICMSEGGEKFKMPEEFDVAEFMRNPILGNSSFNSNKLYLDCHLRINQAPRRSRWTKPYFPDGYDPYTES
jgi:hypothetical protein